MDRNVNVRAGTRYWSESLIVGKTSMTLGTMGRNQRLRALAGL